MSENDRKAARRDRGGWRCHPRMAFRVPGGDRHHAGLDHGHVHRNGCGPDALTTTDTANATLTMQVAGGSANPDCPNDQGMVRITTAGTGVGSATATWSGRSTGWGCTYSVTGVYSGGTGGGGGGARLPAPWSGTRFSPRTRRACTDERSIVRGRRMTCLPGAEPGRPR